MKNGFEVTMNQQNDAKWYECMDLKKTEDRRWNQRVLYLHLHITQIQFMYSTILWVQNEHLTSTSTRTSTAWLFYTMNLSGVANWRHPA